MSLEEIENLSTKQLLARLRLMIAGAVIMTTAGLSALLSKEVPGLPFEKINKTVFYGALFSTALRSFIALRRM
jgi:hypothetical protein